MRTSTLLTAAILSMICLSCTKPFIEERSVTLYFGERHQLKVTSQFSVIYTVENEYHAIVQGSSNTIIARYVGQTVIHADNTMQTADIPLTVVPRYHLYNEPESWDFTLSRYEAFDKFGTPDNMSESYMVYNNYYSAHRFVVHFDAEHNKVSSYSIYLKASLDETSKFLDERYPSVKSQQIQHLWVNALDKQTTTMGITLQEAEINGQKLSLIVYLPYDKDEEFGYDISDWL